MLVAVKDTRGAGSRLDCRFGRRDELFGIGFGFRFEFRCAKQSMVASIAAFIARMLLDDRHVRRHEQCLCGKSRKEFAFSIRAVQRGEGTIA